MTEEFHFESGIDDNIKRLEQCSWKVDDAIARTASFFVLTGITQIRMRASGRPGPNVITGNLRKGYEGDVIERSFLNAKVHIWNTMEYAPYVEFIKGGQYAHYRPGIQATKELTAIYYREQIDEALK